ncbi:hypothetical protein Belba_0107 [Belliella baltica DSM 15883]|uniref:DUF4292 domain-containing protein n=1 Tax=Belliella baltica (strain DSM 15883 / CIP 108006 / LMG 21964 / BA134) TaxID=866536 RepID=I3Z0L0_BELBD|nr:DUF4292 domain-containing protein [Belliella baltica]AFL82778.1 hypothetical protein Belba_0107 [Belliella baltica DSM 15883]
MTRILLGSFILLFLLASGCAKKPNLYISDEVMQEFEPAYFNFSYMNARARIVIEEPSGKTTRGTLNLRAKRDSVIWFSVTPGLGIEALRGIITKDKIRIKDRINGQDINMSYVEFENRFGLNLSLSLFQNLLYANVPEEFSYRDRLIRIGQFFELTQTRENIRYHSKVSTKHGKVEELTSNSMDEKGALLANYASFQDVNNQPFPNASLYKISFSIDGEMQNSIIHIDLSNISVSDTPITFPFQF